MHHRKTFLVVLTALVFFSLAATSQAGENKFQDSFGGNFFNVSPRCPVNQFPTFESIAPVPAIIDPFEQDLIPVFCSVQVNRGNEGVAKAKGTFEADLVVRDNNTGSVESFPVGSGRFKTNSSGRADFDYELPAELFADGFESGDVSAWSYTRTDFSNKKKGNSGQVSCSTASSRSSGQ